MPNLKIYRDSSINALLFEISKHYEKNNYSHFFRINNNTFMQL